MFPHEERVREGGDGREKEDDDEEGSKKDLSYTQAIGSRTNGRMPDRSLSLSQRDDGRERMKDGTTGEIAGEKEDQEQWKNWADEDCDGDDDADRDEDDGGDDDERRSVQSVVQFESVEGEERPPPFSRYTEKATESFSCTTYDAAESSLLLRIP